MAGEAESVFVHVDLRQARPEVRWPIVRFRRAFEPAPQRAVPSGCALLPIGEPLKLPVRRGEIGFIFLLCGFPDGMNQHAVAIRHGSDDARGNIVLHGENTRFLQVSIVSLRPELRAAFRIDETSRDSDSGTPLADTSFDDVTRTEFGA